MEIKLIVNSIGIILTIIGVYVIYINSPVNFSKIDGGNALTDYDKINEKIKAKNEFLKFGVYIVILGSFLQLISNFMN